MLYWICPECGHECSPAIRECPTCTAPPVAPPVAMQEAGQPVPQQTAPSQELLSLAQNFQLPPVAALLAAEPPRQQHLSANGHEVSLSSAAVALEDEPTVEIFLEPEPPSKLEPEPPTTLLPFGKLTFKPNRPARWEMAELSPVPVPVGIGSPAIAPPVAPAPAQCGFKPAEPQQLGAIDFEAANWDEFAAIPQPAGPLPSRRQSVAFMRAELPGTGCEGMALGELAPLAPLVPRSGIERSGDATTPLGCELRSPSLVSSGLNPAEPSLAGLLNALRISAEELEYSAIRAIHTSFAAQSGVALLSAPAEIVQAPAPAGAQCLRSEKPKFTPVEPQTGGRAAVLAGPQTPTLAGPSLPPQLLNFHQQTSSVRPRRSRWSSWPLSLLVITVIILGVVSAVQYFSQDRDTRAASVATPPVQTTKPAAAPRAPVVEEHPAARSVEVAGIRIINGPNKKPQLQFIVINHSAKEITGLNIRIAARSVDAPADTPLFTVSSPVAVLGPNQSKEIRTEVNSSIQPSQIPDWQSLRAEVLIGRQ
jgi:hypothetical protein